MADNWVWNKEIQKFLLSGIPGCMAKTAIAPLDRAKILLQVHQHYYKDFGLFKCLVEIYRREGFRALYKGNVMMLLRIFPYSAIQFYSFDRYLSTYEKWFGIWHINRGLAGSSAGLSALLVTYPLDMVRSRLAFQITGEHKYHGIPNAFSQIYKQEGGLRAFYRGLIPSAIGMVPYSGLSFYAYKNLEVLALEFFPNLFGRKHRYRDEIILNEMSSIGFGAVSGVVAQTIIFPFDVARRRMQLANVLPDSYKYNGMFGTLSAVYRQHGIQKGLYRGLMVNYVRVVPNQSIAFLTLKLLKEFFPEIL